MRFKEYRFEELKVKRYSNWFNFLNEFQDSGLKCAKLEDWTHVNAESCQNAILAACKRFKIHHIKAVIRKGEVFLVNDAITEG